VRTIIKFSHRLNSKAKEKEMNFDDDIDHDGYNTKIEESCLRAYVLAMKVGSICLKVRVRFNPVLSNVFIYWGASG
jgi:hypothetical protein